MLHSQDDIDLDRLRSAALEAIATQKPHIRLGLANELETGRVEGRVDRGEWVYLSVRGVEFGKVHWTRIKKQPTDLG